MKFEENLTNEKITKKFDSQFDMVRSAIQQAKHLIFAGHELDEVKQEKNLATLVLKQIEKGQEITVSAEMTQQEKRLDNDASNVATQHKAR